MGETAVLPEERARARRPWHLVNVGPTVVGRRMDRVVLAALAVSPGCRQCEIFDWMNRAWISP